MSQQESGQIPSNSQATRDEGNLTHSIKKQWVGGSMQLR